MNINASESEYMEQCVAEYADCMIRAAYSILGSIAESEDTVQDAFIKLYRRRPVFNSKSHEKAWLLRVTINHAKNRLRQLRRRCPYEEYSDTVPLTDNDQLRVHEAVRSLSEKYRIIVHLHYFEGYTIKEISHILSIPLSTAGTRFQRAKVQLRKILDMEGL